MKIVVCWAKSKKSSEVNRGDFIASSCNSSRWEAIEGKGWEVLDEKCPMFSLGRLQTENSRKKMNLAGQVPLLTNSICWWEFVEYLRLPWLGSCVTAPDIFMNLDWKLPPWGNFAPHPTTIKDEKLGESVSSDKRYYL